MCNFRLSGLAHPTPELIMFHDLLFMCSGRCSSSSSSPIIVGQPHGKLIEQEYPQLASETRKVRKPGKVLKYGTAGRMDVCFGCRLTFSTISCPDFSLELFHLLVDP